jgi:hypothetical protein
VDLAAVFLLSLLGGYFFAAWWRLTAYATRRYDGHHLYFRAALCGVISFIVALALRIYVVPKISPLQSFDCWLVEYVTPALKEEGGLAAADLSRRAEWVATAVYSLGLGPLMAGLLNCVTPRLWAQRLTVGGLDGLLVRGQREGMPVSITLNTGKVYIGPVVSITDPKGTPTVFRVLPMLSGYRDPQGRMILTIDYEDIYVRLRAAKHLGLPGRWIEQFYLTIRVDAVVTATLFSPRAYAESNPDWKQKIAAQNQKPPPQELLVQLRRP